MDSLRRFICCVVASLWASACIANPVSGAYIFKNDTRIEFLQITASRNGDLVGTIMRSSLQSDGSISQDRTAITGAVDGDSITVVFKQILNPVSLSGTIDESFSGHRSITFALPDGSMRFAGSDIGEYQTALQRLRALGRAVARQHALNGTSSKAQVELMHGYAAEVRRCIEVDFPTHSWAHDDKLNPVATFRVYLDSRGLITNVQLTHSSGVSEFDHAVEKGIQGCSPVPLPPTSNKYPSYLDISYSMYE